MNCYCTALLGLYMFHTCASGGNISFLIYELNRALVACVAYGCNVCVKLQEPGEDVRVSEIIDVYEQKLSALAVSDSILTSGIQVIIQ